MGCSIIFIHLHAFHSEHIYMQITFLAMTTIQVLIIVSLWCLLGTYISLPIHLPMCTFLILSKFLIICVCTGMLFDSSVSLPLSVITAPRINPLWFLRPCWSHHSAGFGFSVWSPIMEKQKWRAIISLSPRIASVRALISLQHVNHHYVICHNFCSVVPSACTIIQRLDIALVSHILACFGEVYQGFSNLEQDLTQVSVIFTCIWITRTLVCM